MADGNAREELSAEILLYNDARLDMIIGDTLGVGDTLEILDNALEDSCAEEELKRADKLSEIDSDVLEKAEDTA